jgi:pimeloyl-ACP methyl ester carboxylesterase
MAASPESPPPDSPPRGLRQCLAIAHAPANVRGRQARAGKNHASVIAVAVTILALVVAVVGYFALETRRIARDAERAVPPSGNFATIDGNRIHYLETGKGKPILFIHGLGGHLLQLSHPLFGRFGDGYRLIALDRPGSNYSTREGRSTGRLPEQAAMIVDFIDTIGLEKPLLVGHSLGGAIALAVALDHPEKISGLALISPYTHHNERMPAEFAALKIRSAFLRRFIAHTFAAPMALRSAPAVLALVFGPQHPPAAYAVDGGALALLRPQHIFGTSTDMVAMDEDMPQQQECYGEIKLPVGILFGTADRVLDYKKHGLQMREKLDGLDLELVEAIGHMPQYAVPQRVIAFIRGMAD